MSARIDPTRPFIPLRLAVLTISDTRTPKTDKSGPLLVQMIEEAGHIVADRMVVPDDRRSIRKAVKRWVKAGGVDVVITTGGTGFTERDVTPEAVRPLFDKEIDGFSVLFHMLSYQTVGTSTVQSRACGGLAKKSLIFSVPGSPGACEDAWNGILKLQLDNRHRPCSFVELLPRFTEGKKKKKKK
ncbi:MAG: molybdenum cofactor biosynthesis protein B [Methyloceanibacter sp.]|jgi:molybdenum cofactor biosynthesis protein B|uniref:molybdenum cofactor biosynthesis protein B n=1 Tax=Methyloceanibacter sp. TaxID=1965321 RepID=UPI003C4E709F